MRSSLALATLFALPLGGQGLRLIKNELAHECAPPTTVTVTETVSGVASGDTTPGVAHTSTKLQEVTVTDTLTVLGVSQNEHSVKPGKVTGQVYPFSMSNGRTAWLGPTPASTGNFQIVATTITVYPTENASGLLPSQVSAQPSAAATTTEFHTIFSTKTLTLSGSDNLTTAGASKQTSPVHTTNGTATSYVPFNNGTAPTSAESGSTHFPISYVTIHVTESQTNDYGYNSTIHVATTSLNDSASTITRAHHTLGGVHHHHFNNSSISSSTFHTLPMATEVSTTLSENATASTILSALSTKIGPAFTNPTSTCVDTTHSGLHTLRTLATPILTSLTLTPAVITSTFPVSSFQPSPLPNVSSVATASNSTAARPGAAWSTLSYAPVAPISAHRVSTDSYSTFHTIVGVLPPVHGHGGPVVKRIATDMVTATINGDVVFWENEYAGTVFATTPLATSTAPQSSLMLVNSTLTAGVAATSTSSANLSTPTVCPASELGNFTINFDDLPMYNEPANKTFYPPIRNPYHSLMWSDGWSYAPPPPVKVRPTSGSELGVFLVNNSTNVHSANYSGAIPSSGDVNGMFGAGPNYFRSAFWFNAHSAFVACDVPGDHGCQVQIQGWKYDAATQQSCKAAFHEYLLPAYGGEVGLQLLPLDSTFHNLTALQYIATDVVTNSLVTYYVDDIALEWSNNTCAAALERLESI